MSMLPKIRMLFCGGTMVMNTDGRGGLQSPANSDAMAAILNFEPRLQEIANIHVLYIANVDSSDITPEIWEKIASSIYEEQDQYDGFVVIHGTDTMAYTASAVSFALQNLKKPVVFTGAQIPGRFLESDARRNLVNAVKLAGMNVPDVMVLFGDRILRGVRASKTSHTKLNAFSSINYPKLGSVGVKLKFYQEFHRKTNKAPTLANGFERKVVSLSLIPGMPVDLLFDLLEKGAKGLILSAYGTGNIPHLYLPFLSQAYKSGIPIVIRSQCAEGSTNMRAYANGERALEFGAIEAYDMSREATTTKLMWALHQTQNLPEIKSIMHRNYVGEIHVE